ncbi:MAG: sigma-70 family RNA polymerase sigma factor [Candidatus Niyogibacteria bacterium]|nr:sigma-70 family RNA polymerase sigma factor [Candidatus Niyogibacteria bacterium]
MRKKRNSATGHTNDPFFIIIRQLGLRKNARQIVEKALDQGFVVKDDLAAVFSARKARKENGFRDVLLQLLRFFTAHNVVVLREKPSLILSQLFPSLRREKKNKSADDSPDLFTMYASDIARNGLKELLSDAEMRELARLRDGGDKKALSKMIEHNLRLVVSVVNRYRGYGLEYMDMIQEGNLGLIKAAEKFDYRRENTFATYAYWWIEQRILRACLNHADLIRTPVYIKEYRFKVNQICEKLTFQLRRPPTHEEVALELDDSVENVKKILEWADIKIVSYDHGDEDAGEEEAVSTIEAWRSDSSLNPENLLMARDEWAALLKELDQLFADVNATGSSSQYNKRNVDIFKKRYGIGIGFEHATLEEVAQIFGITRERVRQIVNQIWLRLQSRDVQKNEEWLLSAVDRLEELTTLLGTTKS